MPNELSRTTSICFMEKFPGKPELPEKTTGHYRVVLFLRKRSLKTPLFRVKRRFIEIRMETDKLAPRWRASSENL